MKNSTVQSNAKSSENSNPREKTNQGFYKRRRGVYEHIMDGTIDLLEDGIHDFLCLSANLVIGGDSSKPAGVCFTSAPAIHSHCPRVSERTIQRCLEHFEAIYWIKTFRKPNQRGNYPVIICRATVHDLSGNEYRVNAEKTIDWEHPVYEPVGQLSPETSNSGGYKRSERLEKREAEEAAATDSEKNQTLRGKGRKFFEEAWSTIGMEPCGSLKFTSAWERIYGDRPEDEPLSAQMEHCIQHCQANGIRVPPPFFQAKRRVEEKESEDDSEVRRVAGPRGLSPEYEAEQRAREEREQARFNGLSREEKLAELKGELVNTEQWITSAKETGKQLANWVMDRKAELERKIAELSSPVCKEETCLRPEEEAQLLLSQFPEGWDSQMVMEVIQ